MTADIVEEILSHQKLIVSWGLPQGLITINPRWCTLTSFSKPRALQVSNIYVFGDPLPRDWLFGWEISYYTPLSRIERGLNEDSLHIQSPELYYFNKMSFWGLVLVAWKCSDSGILYFSLAYVIKIEVYYIKHRNRIYSILLIYILEAFGF